MKNQSKHELAAAKKTWASLEANSAETASDVEVFRLGKLIRESGEAELPDADLSLREQVISVLERMPDQDKRSPKDKPSKQPLVRPRVTRVRWIKFSTAAALALVIGGVLWMSVLVKNSHRNWEIASGSRSEAVSLAQIQLEEAKKDDSRERLLASERTGRAMQLAQPESQLKASNDLFVQLGHAKDSEAHLQQLETPSEYRVALNQDSTSTLDYRFIPGVNTGVNLKGGVGLVSDLNLDDGFMEIPDVESWKRKVIRRSKYEGIRLNGEKDRSLGTEQYDPIVENRFIAAVDEEALSTFSIDVDTASYSNMRRFINSGQRPPANSIRIEELINYFRYDYPQPEDEKPFRVAMEVAECPWQAAHRLVRIGIKGKDVHRNERPASNLVFLLDVSGSMKDRDKLPLLQRGLQMMLERLTENDRVSIVTYASNAGVRLEPTSGDQKIKIRNVIESLAADGSTNGSAGIEKAYDLAVRNFIKDGTNRVILATDGDLNVGVTDDDALVKLIKGKASEGVFLTVLGFGTGNLKDSKLEKLADNGNGVYAYIDSIREARKVLVEQMSGSLVTIAKDVKLQVEFNPGEVRAYRLLGYENRKMANADFANDRKDAGEIGAGHTVTALYEIVPAGLVEPQTLSTNLKYQQVEKPGEVEKPKQEQRLSAAAKSGDLLTLAIRYKLPDANESTRSEFTLADSKKRFYEASGDFRFAAAVASFGMLLRNSQFSGDVDLAKVEKIASESIGEDTAGYRAEFVDLVRQFASATKE